MSMVPYKPEDYDCYCKVCKKQFIFARDGIKCPYCDNENSETITIIMGGSLGHEEPLSVWNSRH